jgi:hypothetical protein
MTQSPRGPRRPGATIALEVLVRAATVFGGVGPAWHDVLRMPDSWMEHGPFSSWLVPGLLLLLVLLAVRTSRHRPEGRSAAPAAEEVRGDQLASTR